MRSFTRLKNVCVIVCVAVVLFTVPAFAVVQLDSTAPTDAPFSGGYFVGGTDSALGEVVIYVSDNHGWTLDDTGNLFRYANNSASGRMWVNGTMYQFNAPAFSLPQYREYYGSGYQYTQLFLEPMQGNIIIDDTFATPYDLQTMCSVFACFLLGMLLVVKLIKRG